MFQGACLFDDWTDFVQQVSELPSDISIEEAAPRLGLDAVVIRKMVEHSIDSWRNSTSTSLLNGLANLRIGVVPVAGSPIFDNIMWQTRYLVMAQKWLIPEAHYVILRDEKRKALRIGEYFVYTLSPEGHEDLNTSLRGLYLYAALNSRKAVKLPKAIYRGIRIKDFYEVPEIRAVIDNELSSDLNHFSRRRIIVDAVRDLIVKKGLAGLSHAPLLSFTSSRACAKYFANGEGLVVRIDPSKAEIIASDRHEALLAEPEPLKGKLEREFIVRLPEGLCCSPDDIEICDLDYLLDAKSPLAVEYFNHNTTRAIYEMDGVKVSAMFHWNANGKGGKLLFKKVDDSSWMMTRGAFRKDFGFDPLPSESNLASVTNFRLEKRPGDWSEKWKAVD